MEMKQLLFVVMLASVSSLSLQAMLYEDIDGWVHTSDDLWKPIAFRNCPGFVTRENQVASDDVDFYKKNYPKIIQQQVEQFLAHKKLVIAHNPAEKLQEMRKEEQQRIQEGDKLLKNFTQIFSGIKQLEKDEPEAFNPLQLNLVPLKRWHKQVAKRLQDKKENEIVMRRIIELSEKINPEQSSK